jgi:hypothetical protein
VINESKNFKLSKVKKKFLSKQMATVAKENPYQHDPLLSSKYQKFTDGICCCVGNMCKFFEKSSKLNTISLALKFCEGRKDAFLFLYSDPCCDHLSSAFEIMKGSKDIKEKEKITKMKKFRRKPRKFHPLLLSKIVL